MVITAEQERNLISLRRSKISELLSKGYTSGAEIARTLNVSEPTISRDLKWISEESRKTLDTFTQKKLHEEFRIAIDTYDYVIKTAAHTADTTQDERTKNEALKIVRDTRAVKWDLISYHDVVNYQRQKGKETKQVEDTEEPEQQEKEELIDENNQQQI